MCSSAETKGSAGSSCGTEEIVCLLVTLCIIRTIETTYFCGTFVSALAQDDCLPLAASARRSVMQWAHLFHEDGNPRLDAFLAVSDPAFDFSSLVPPWGRGNGTVLDWLVFGAALEDLTVPICMGARGHAIWPTAEYTAAYIEVVKYLHQCGVPCIKEVSFENLQRCQAHLSWLDPLNAPNNMIFTRMSALRLLGVVAAGRATELKEIRDARGRTALDRLVEIGIVEDDCVELFSDTVPPDPQQHVVLMAAKSLGAHGLTADASLANVMDHQFGMLWEPGDQVSSENLSEKCIHDVSYIFLIMAAGLTRKLLDLGCARCEDYLNYLVHQAMLGGAWPWVREVLEQFKAVTRNIVGKIRIALEEEVFFGIHPFETDSDEIRIDIHRRWDLALSWHRQQLGTAQPMVNTLLYRLLLSIPGATLEDEVLRCVDSFLYALRTSPAYFEVWRSGRL